MELVLTLLVLHGLLGGLDVVLNHELAERLPHRPGAAMEEALHAAREALFATLFLGLAWFEWHGAAAWLVAAVIACEVAVSTWDSVLEDQTRRLPPLERVLHVALLINLGAYTTLLVPHWLAWRALPSAVAPVSHGWQSLALTALGLAAIAWCLRDALSSRRLRQAPAAAAATAIR
jgi:hypothetical protein